MKSYSRAVAEVAEMIVEQTLEDTMYDLTDEDGKILGMEFTYRNEPYVLFLSEELYSIKIYRQGNAEEDKKLKSEFIADVEREIKECEKAGEDARATDEANAEAYYTTPLTGMNWQLNALSYFN